jgi:hypothetical protein
MGTGQAVDSAYFVAHVDGRHGCVLYEHETDFGLW